MQKIVLLVLVFACAAMAMEPVVSSHLSMRDVLAKAREFEKNPHLVEHVYYGDASEENNWCSSETAAKRPNTHPNGKTWPNSATWPIPSCGTTVCDNPDLIRGYMLAQQRGLLPSVTIPYKVVYFANVTGVSRLTTPSNNALQQTVLNDAYGVLGVQFNGTAVPIHNLAWMYKMMVPSCSPTDITDGYADDSCDSIVTGFDGGDTSSYGTFKQYCFASGSATLSGCTNRYYWFTNVYGNSLLPACSAGLQGNGVCNAQCNFAEYNWDGGDCCPNNITPFSIATMCRQPSATATNRGWVSTAEYKSQVNMAGSTALNQYIVAFPPDNNILGFATFPWGGGQYSVQGGIVYNPAAWGVTSATLIGVTAVHEVGHAMGLWHVFHTIELANQCGSCGENVGGSSLTNGDLCADTGATTVDYYCQDPAGTDCNNRAWTNTPFHNYMNYGDDLCLNQFTPNQQARMRCYIDYAYEPWVGTTIPGTIVQPPQVSNSSGSAVVTWAPPVAVGAAGTATILSYTLERRNLTNNATTTFTVAGNLYTYTDTGCTNAALCSYRVKAVNSAGAATFFSPSSNDALAPTPVPTPLPNAAAPAATLTAALMVAMVVLTTLALLA